jgi:hypothetical protein
VFIYFLPLLSEKHFCRLHPHMFVARGLTFASDSMGVVSALTCSNSKVVLKLWVPSRQLNSLDGESAHIKVSAYAGQHRHRKVPTYLRPRVVQDSNT